VRRLPATQAAADTNNADNADFVDIDYTSHLAAKTASH